MYALMGRQSDNLGRLPKYLSCSQILKIRWRSIDIKKKHNSQRCPLCCFWGTSGNPYSTPSQPWRRHKADVDAKQTPSKMLNETSQITNCRVTRAHKNQERLFALNLRRERQGKINYEHRISDNRHFPSDYSVTRESISESLLPNWHLRQMIPRHDGGTISTNKLPHRIFSRTLSVNVDSLHTMISITVQQLYYKRHYSSWICSPTRVSTFF